MTSSSTADEQADQRQTLSRKPESPVLTEIPSQSLYHRRESFDDDYSLNLNLNDETTSENLNAAINSLLDLNNDLIYDDGQATSGNDAVSCPTSAHSAIEMTSYLDVDGNDANVEDVDDVLWDDDSRPESATVVSDVWNNGRKSRWQNNQL